MIAAAAGYRRSRLSPGASIGRGMLLLLAAHAQSAQSAQDMPARYAFAIPAQRLSRALARFSEASGVDVLLDDPRSGERRSAALNGTYSAPQALNVMLAGTGLVARFTSARSAVIIARADALAAGTGTAADRAGQPGMMIELDTMRVTAPRMIGGRRAVPDPTFLRAMASQIRRIMIDGAVFGAADRQRLRIQTRIRANGTLHDVRIITPSGDDRRDGHVVRLLEDCRLDLAPPEGLRDPLMFDVAAQ